MSYNQRVQAGRVAESSSLTARWAAYLRSDSMVRQGALVFCASMFGNICGFLFHAIASRRLGVEEYGALYALISAFLIVATPFNIFATVVAKFAAEFRALRDASHLRGLVLGLVRGCAIIGVGYMIVAVIVAVPLARFLHVSAWTIPFIGLIVAVALLSALLRAFAQGTQDFLGYSFSSAGEGIAKVLGIIFFTAVGWHLFGGLMAFFVGALTGVVIIGLGLYRRYAPVAQQPVRYDWRRIALTSGGSAALTIVIMLMGYADVVIVKHSFDPTQAGIYSAASLGGKILFFLVGFIPTVLLPQAADRHARGERTHGVLLASCWMLAGFAFCGLLAFRVLGIVLLHALVGNAYDAAQGLLVWYGSAMALLALTNVLGSYGIATHRFAFAVPALLLTIATLSTIAFYHPSLLSVVKVLFIGNLITTVAVALVLGLQGMRTQPVASAG